MPISVSLIRKKNKFYNYMSLASNPKNPTSTVATLGRDFRSDYIEYENIEGCCCSISYNCLGFPGAVGFFIYA